MPNSNPLTNHLIRQTPKWNSQPTKALRVPEAFITAVESYARMLDGSVPPELETEQKQSQPTRVKTDLITCFGIRPSISELGWAVLQGKKRGQHPRVVDFGVVQTDSKQAIASRLAEIELDLSLLLKQFQPSQIVIENPFVNFEFRTTAAKTLQTLGVIQATVYRQCGVAPVLIYAATWKSQIDSPRASREELAFSVKLLFDLDRLPLNASVDAIAIAYAGFCGLGIQ
jgi:crossover junction endodeoxyribonuclease RuvC